VSPLAALLLAATLPNNMAAAHATPADCKERLLPSSPRTATGKRAITAHDLIELRDFGRAEGGGESSALSPDGKLAVLTLRRAEVASDSYCIGVVLVVLDGTAPPRLLDVGGEPILGTNDVFGIPGIVSGVVRPGTPVWSPDGKSVAYLRRDGGITQAWRVGLDGGAARPVTNLPTEVLSVAWGVGGDTLVISTRASLAAAEAEIGREEAGGFLYDERFWLARDVRPHPRLPLPVEYLAVTLATGDARAVSPAEAEALTRSGRARPEGAELLADAQRGNRAWISLRDPELPFGPSDLHLEVAGRDLPCSVELCRDRVSGLWWRGANELIVMHGPSAANGGRTAFFRWRVGMEPAPVKLFETTDLLASCQLVDSGMYCARERADEPRAIIRVDLASGNYLPVFDPNPEFAGVALGRTVRLRWTDSDGVPSFGDLVLPPDHKPGQRHPLVIVQYLSRGFMRGGTGDEYPIHLFTSRGFAVLSFQKPEPLPAMLKAKDVDEAQRVNVTGWAERRRIFRSLEAGIDVAIATGSIDPSKIGITGFSDGSGTVQFALNNSTRFAAAAISSCCDEPGIMFALGPSYAASGARWGYPLAGADGRDYWKPQSLSLNAERIRVPLLMQLPDSEARAAAETFAALKGHGAPVEMYVFAGENHIKTRPLHRYAIYMRSLDWFGFWLRGVMPTDPARRSELERWQALRRRLSE
jgi:hypothetical protein